MAHGRRRRGADDRVRLLVLALDARTAALLALALWVAVLELIGEDRWYGVAAIALGALPYNLYLRRVSLLTGDPPRAMAWVDPVLFAPFAFAYPVLVPGAALAGLANLSVQSAIFGLRSGLIGAATLTGAIGAVLAVGTNRDWPDLDVDTTIIVTAALTVLAPLLVVVVDALNQRQLAAQRRLLDLLGAVDALLWEYDPAVEQFSLVTQSGGGGGPKGMGASSLVADFSTFLARIPDDQRAELGRELDELIAGRRNHAELEFSFEAFDGSRRRLRTNMLAISDDAGLTTLVRGITVDVTERHEMEEAQREMVRLAEAEAAARVVVRKLEAALRPPPLVVPGIELGVAYQPADETAPTGGDLYDWLLRPDGDVDLVIVDVLGKGVDATRDAIAVISAMRTLLFEGVPVSDVVERTASVLEAQDPDLVATCMVARLRPSTGELTLAGGGHPPAFVMPADGPPCAVEARGMAIGWPGAGSEGTAEVHLGPGGTLLLYTDGLVEAGKDILAGMDQVARGLERQRHLAARPLAEALVDEVLATGTRRDDTLALVLKRT